MRTRKRTRGSVLVSDRILEEEEDEDEDEEEDEEEDERKCSCR